MDTDNILCPACGAEIPANALLCPKCGRANISSAFAEPPGEQRDAPTPQSTVSLSFETGGENTLTWRTPSQSNTESYAETGIPKTIMPWDTPAGSDADERQELLQQAVNSLEALRQEEVVEQDALRQQAVHNIDELRQLKATGTAQHHGIRHVPVTQPQYTPQAPQGNPSAGAGSAQYTNYPSSQASNQREYTVRHISYEPTQEYYYQAQYSDSQIPLRGSVRPGINPNTAANLEYLGYIGLLGVGHMYAGFAGRGLGLFLSWLIVVELLVQWALRGLGLWLFLLALAVPWISSRWVAWSIRNSMLPPE